MSKDDPNYIIKVEKAISEKYGDETVQHPKRHWTQEKEQKYLEQLKEYHARKDSRSQDREKTLYKGILVSKNLINRKSRKKCDWCGKYSLEEKDDVYFVKYDACFQCYVKYVEDREERLGQGWRPTQGE